MNIYVSNLNFSTTSESLQELFAAYGEVESAKIITDRESGRSRGFGFVEMPNDTEVQNAISGLHDTDFEGKTIGVSIARPKTERSSGGYNNRGGNGGYNRNRY
jgi:RNA recognition motif-containing protein